MVSGYEIGRTRKRIKERNLFHNNNLGLRDRELEDPEQLNLHYFDNNNITLPYKLLYLLQIGEE